MECFSRCTACGREWGHRDEPQISSKPMLENDGRDTEGGCVPYAISKATGLPIKEVQNICRSHGWNAGGMHEADAIRALKEMGFDAVPGSMSIFPNGGRKSLAKFRANAHPSHTYIVSIDEHWLTIVQGQNMDNRDSGGNSIVIRYWRIIDRRDVRKAA
jgi:hypothetical protein